MRPEKLIALGMVLAVLGIALAVIGSLLIAASAATGGGPGEASVGGLVLIGPIPIVFGVGPHSDVLVVVALLLALALMAIVVLLGWRR